MISIISLFLIVSISILVTRIATIALTHTGLSKKTARFQARSAFTGSGFTTSESENVVNHPLRRRIILLLMLLGNAGFATAVSSLILTFVDQSDSESIAVKVILLTAGLAVLWSLAMSPWVDRHLSHLTDRALKRYTQLDVKDYASMMHLTGEYRIVEMQVEHQDWIAHKTLAETQLRDEGIVVLGVRRPDGTYLGGPKGHTKTLPEDSIIVYGRIAAIEELDQRRKDRRGDLEHKEAIAEQEEVIEKEKQEDPERSSP